MGKPEKFCTAFVPIIEPGRGNCNPKRPAASKIARALGVDVTEIMEEVKQA